MSITRKFTTTGEDPLAGITFVKRSSRIGSGDGSHVFSLDEVEVPDTWDQTAVDILASKYLRRAGVPQRDANGELVLVDGEPVLGGETSIKQVAGRMAHAWRVWGERGGYFATEADAESFFDEMLYMLVTQMAAPNSPQWFNTGLFEAYGIIEDSDGNFWWDDASGVARTSTHKYERTAASACYILGVQDRLVGEASIMEHVQTEARLFKAGSGSGSNFSRLREKGGRLSAGGSSSGLMSFLRVHDRAAGAIKSGGTTRRAAKMVIVDTTHPDIFAFIESKVLEEKKVAALVAAGYSSDFNGEAYDTVAFQNANNSVRIAEGFMEALRAGATVELTSRYDGAVLARPAASQLWGAIAEAAHSCADPGVQYDDILNDWNTAADTERVRGTNPCSEYTHVDDTACNLASLNLVSFFDTASQQFDVAAFAHACRLWTLTLEITVSAAHYPTALVAQRSWEHRTLGLGYANLGALLMRAGLAYDSDKARAVIGAVTALMHNSAYATSAEMAKALGPCAAYAENRTSLLRVVGNHRRAAVGSLAARRNTPDYVGVRIAPQEVDHLTLAHTCFADLSEAVIRAAEQAHAQVSEHGVRNMQVTVLAPTGTIGLVMGCDTTGVEPDFALVKDKKLAGGGYMRIVNASVAPALAALGYSAEQIDRMAVYMLGTGKFDHSAINVTALSEAGLKSSEIADAEAELRNLSDITFAFAPHVIGDGAYQRHGLDAAAGPGKLLAKMGFSAGDLLAASKHSCGHLTLEGCRELKAEHLAVFDCAVPCGDGSRVISWEGHVRALGAASAHLSGAISKTVNMPASSTVEDVKAAYELAYRLGVKCVAIYRDGSKMSQPLSSAKSGQDGETAAAVVVTELRAGTSPTEFYRGSTPPRFKLLNMRMGPTWRFTIGGEEVYLRAGEYPDGTLGEIFIDWGKQGSTLRGITSALSIAISQALQHGVPLEKFISAYRGHTFEPAGIVGGNDNLKMASSLIDAIVRILGLRYGGRTDLVQVPPGAETPPAGPDVVTGRADHPASGERIHGERCSNCGGSHLMRAGSCKVCGDCGETTGCS